MREFLWIILFFSVFNKLKGNANIDDHLDLFDSIFGTPDDEEVQDQLNKTIEKMTNMEKTIQEKMTNMEKSIQRLSELTIGLSAEEYNKLNDVVKAIVAKLSGGWIRNPDTGFSYIIIEQDLTWDEAGSACRNKDERADLAFIRNQREQEFIIRNFLQSRSCSGLYWYNSCGVWIGLRDTVGDNQNYEWSAKFPVTYTNWLPGEPNVRQERCGAQQTVSPYKWWDAPCSAKRPVLCVKTENSCLEGWSHYPPTGSCFKTLDEKLYWEEAKTTCAAMARGSSLAKITTREENNFVVDLMKKNDKNEKVGYWMGANDVGRESFYVWLDGSKVVPLSTVVPYWKSGEPNNLHNNEDCIHWFKEYNYGWNDASCKLDYRGQRGMSAVCKMPAL